MMKFDLKSNLSKITLDDYQSNFVLPFFLYISHLKLGLVRRKLPLIQQTGFALN